MRVFKRYDYEIEKIEFCCKKMAEQVLLGEIKTEPWSSGPLEFRLQGHIIRYCPHCGSMINGDVHQYEEE